MSRCKKSVTRERRVRIWQTRVAGTLAAVLIAPAVATAATLSLSGDGLALPIGATAPVAVTIDDAAGVEGAYLRIAFDGQLVSPQSVAASPLTESCMIESNTGSPNEVRVALACAEALTGSGSLLTIGFLGQQSGMATLDLQECLLNEGTPTCTAVDGTIAVSSCILDVDGSGGGFDVATDGVYIARRILGLSTVPGSFRESSPTIPDDSAINARIDPAVASQALDVDDDGTVSVATDVVYIVRRFLGLTTVPPSFPAGPLPNDAEIDALCP